MFKDVVNTCDINLNEAIDKAYAIIGENGVHFKEMQFRKDIGRI